MIKYTSNEKFTIWANEAEWEYYVQIAGGEIEMKPFRTASEAIENAYNR